ncbi:unnamed protein product [Penicillium roqueforti FM164]|uniref:Genomic scaffold, ProqFM164S02 n=1 Tax=Penicillium roqueforti (strain FM164) TaxID=1365484 RepID=W6Q5P8_PENRF|nr:unnamed protein product [Penicillium roqueforti FM164]
MMLAEPTALEIPVLGMVHMPTSLKPSLKTGLGVTISEWPVTGYTSLYILQHLLEVLSSSELSARIYCWCIASLPCTGQVLAFYDPYSLTKMKTMAGQEPYSGNNRTGQKRVTPMISPSKGHSSSAEAWLMSALVMTIPQLLLRVLAIAAFE